MAESSDQRTGERLQGLRDRGFRVTKQRELICRTLDALPGHPTAYEIHRAVRREAPQVSLATVYTTLAALSEVGAVAGLGAFGRGPARYESNRDPHANFICTRCGRIEDIFDALVSALREGAEQRGHSVQGVRVVLYGICSGCEDRLTPGVRAN